jgi:hypothetical protein
MTAETLLSDVAIWATILVLAVGGGAAAGIVLVWALTLPVTGPRMSREDARAASARILRIAVVVFVAAFIGALVVGAFQ